jgi:hypothetical protein
VLDLEGDLARKRQINNGALDLCEVKRIREINALDAAGPPRLVSWVTRGVAE